MRKASLRLKLLLATAALFIVGMTALVLVASNAFYDAANITREQVIEQASRQAQSTLSEASQATVESVQVLLEQGYATVDTLAHQLARTALGSGDTPYPRTIVRTLARDALASNASLSAIYAQFEPDAYDARDTENAGNLNHSSDTGTLEVYYVREPGGLTFYSSEDPEEKYLNDIDENGIREAEWYLCSMDSGAPCLLDPYLYEIEAGNETLMTTLSIPVMVNGQFRGLVGGDINLPILQRRINAISERLFDGAGDALLVSERGLLVASSEYPNQLGQALSRVDSSLSDVTQYSGFSQQNGQWYYTQSLSLLDVPQQWILIISVPEAAILASAISLSESLEAQAESAIIRLVMLGIAAIAVGLICIVVLLNSIVTPISRIARSMNDLASNEGDLTKTLTIDKHKELIELTSGFNRFAEKLREMIQAMKHQNTGVRKDSAEMGRTTEQVSRAVQQQNSQLDGVVVAMNEMSSTAAEVARLAGGNASAADEARIHIIESQTTLERNQENIETLSRLLESCGEQISQVARRSDNIYGILESIRGIAEQTNLLALNAAIEAARAGEQGRGFAVVADEVRTLAARTQDATQEVDTLIKGLQEDVASAVGKLDQSREEMSETVKSTRKSTERLNEAVQSVRDISDNAVQVATAAEEQSQVNEEIDRSIADIGSASKELSELALTAERLTNTTLQAVQELDAQLNRLKV